VNDLVEFRRRAHKPIAASPATGATGQYYSASVGSTTHNDVFAVAFAPCSVRAP
jgi:hypothetical protein